MKKQNTDIYGEPVTYETGKFIITISRPILTPEERERRMNRIKESAVKLVLATEKAKRAKEMDEKKESAAFLPKITE